MVAMIYLVLHLPFTKAGRKAEGEILNERFKEVEIFDV